MTDLEIAVRIDLNGNVRELDIGTVRSQQIRIIGRALLDNIQAVDFIRQPTGPDIVIIAAPTAPGRPPTSTPPAPSTNSPHCCRT
ncbi:hypothetical protein [Streptomyces sp. NPDC059564]|uniref:hypothetical protein n=1 Tax=Streptomyces sp. NPDC059564 TaxID=3346865 RepID=UPI0036B75A67